MEVTATLPPRSTLSETDGAPTGTLTRQEVLRALDAVYDPELDEPITDLGFVQSVDLGEMGALEVRLRLPTSFCSPNFAYLMASDAKDALAALPGSGQVVIQLVDHHDSDIINRGLAADAGYRGTFRHEAEQDLDELRETFRRKAHTAAMERCLTALLRARSTLAESDVGTVVMGELPDDATTAALRRRRTSIGLRNDADALVLVDENGVGYQPHEVPMRLRRARSTRISVDGNAHFCRGLLRTRYPGSGDDQTPRLEGAEPPSGGPGRIDIPLTVIDPAAEQHREEYRR